MRLAFVLYRYTPWGGLQRDALRIAHASAALGHAPEFHVLDWHGPPPGFPVHVVPAPGWTQPARNRALAARAQALQGQTDCDGVIGFNKLPGLDAYYAADDCYRARPLGGTRRWTARWRQFLDYEAAVFGASPGTGVLCLTPEVAQRYARAYPRAAGRIQVLPPAVPPPLDADPAARQRIRDGLRAELGVPASAGLLLGVGSAFHRKGMDRALHALAALPEAMRGQVHLLVVGDDRAAPLRTLALRLGVAGQLHLPGPRDDVPRLMTGADLLVHLARQETAGMVLLEALAAGLPVLTTAVCGYAPQVAASGGGRVLAEPYAPVLAVAALTEMLAAPRRRAWGDAGRAYAAAAQATPMAVCAAQAIEAHLKANRG